MQINVVLFIKCYRFVNEIKYYIELKFVRNNLYSQFLSFLCLFFDNNFSCSFIMNSVSQFFTSFPFQTFNFIFGFISFIIMQFQTFLL